MLSNSSQEYSDIRNIGNHSEFKRLGAIDALRGLAILLMIFSEYLPGRILPAWMYSAQFSSGSSKSLADTFTINWSDLIFPFFLFSLGASIPSAIERHLERKEKLNEYIYIFQRTLFLILFALFHSAFHPYVLSENPTLLTWIASLLAFGGMFFIFVKLPPNWHLIRYLLYRAIGWGCILILILHVKYPDGQTFSIKHIDPYLVTIVNVYFLGALIYIITRDNILPRLAIIGLLAVMNLISNTSVWIKHVWEYTPLPHLYQFRNLMFLIIVLPGTIIGQTLYQSLPLKGNPKEESRLLPVAFLALFQTPITLYFLYNFPSYVTLLINVLLCTLFFIFFLTEDSSLVREVRKLFLWGSFWLFLGLLFREYDQHYPVSFPSLSLLFTSTGLAILLLNSFWILTDLLDLRKWFIGFINNGQNPMLAYTSMGNFIIPLVNLIGLQTILNRWCNNNFSLVLISLFYTLLLAFLISLCSHRKIFWRT